MKRIALLISVLAVVGAACSGGESTLVDPIEAPTKTAPSTTTAESSATTTVTATSVSTETTTTAPASTSTTTAISASSTSTTQSTSTTWPATTTTLSTSTTTATTTTEDKAKTVDVSIENFRFAPASVKIHVGDTVRWTVNSGTHTTTSDTAVWDSTTMATGEAFTFRFDQAGDFPYFCAIHTGMRATVTVEG